MDMEDEREGRLVVVMKERDGRVRILDIIDQGFGVLGHD